MKQTGNRSAWILFGIALFLCLILFVFIFGHRMPRNKDRYDEGDAGFSVVSNGIAIDIPEGYSCYPDEDSDLLIYKEGDCSLLLRITEETFDDLYRNKKHLPEEAEGKGYLCLTGIKEIRIREKMYLYFAIEYHGGTQYVIYTDAGANHSAYVVLDAAERREQEALEMAASILESVRDTDEEDTEIYDYLLLQIKPQDRNYVSNAWIRDEQGRILAGYGIPEGFYTDGNIHVYGAEGYEQNYIRPERSKNVREGKNIYVTVSLKPEEDAAAEEAVDQKRRLWDLSISAVRQTERNGYTIYYIGNSYVDTVQGESVTMYEFYAVTDFGDEQLYQLEAWAYDREQAMEPETYEAFFTIERE